jgi:hypothetical protein
VTSPTNQALPKPCNPVTSKSLTHRDPGCDLTRSHENMGVIHSFLPRVLHNVYTYKAKTTLTHQILVFIKKLKAHDIEVNDEWE